jgi:hypothetical protein
LIKNQEPNSKNQNTLHFEAWFLEFGSWILDLEMAKCEQGYLCDVCGTDVEEMTGSDLYLRYILGEVRPEQLHVSRERHIRCNPALAQFIVDPAFEPVPCEGPFAKQFLDSASVADQEARVTRAWRRLQELPSLGLPILEYPLPEVRQVWQKQKAAADVPS